MQQSHRDRRVAVAHTLTSLAQAAVLDGPAPSTRAGMVAIDSPETPIRLIIDLAHGMGFHVGQLFLGEFGTDGDAVRAVRSRVERLRSEDLLVAFVIHHAASAPGDMLERTARVIREATVSGHSIILALSGSQEANINQMGRDIADGLAVAPDRVMGWPTFRGFDGATG